MVGTQGKVHMGDKWPDWHSSSTALGFIKFSECVWRWKISSIGR